MSDALEPLHALADAAGLQRRWRDVEGRDHVVPDATLRGVLRALGHKVDTPRQIGAALKTLEAEHGALPALVIADAGQPVELPSRCSRAEFADGDTWQPLEIRDGRPIAPPEPGYFDCRFDGEETRLAVAPPHCPVPPHQGHRSWGASLQIPSLRPAGGGAFGTLGDLADAVETLAQAGADAVAINPVHALFPGNGEHFSPYSPSSRRFLNAAMADPVLLGLPALPEDESGSLIDWESALPSRLSQMRALFDSLSPQQRADLVGQPEKDEVLHAVFDTLDCHYRPKGAKGWRDWPRQYRNPASKAVSTFAAKYADEVEFHLAAQALARAGLAKVQDRAKAAGMSIGLVGDLAVGVDPGGSDCWTLGNVMLRGLTIGAPPDPLGPHGQNWNITGFSPEGLRRTGFAPWIAMIRAALASGGGLRIDHAFGLARLWVIPEGGGPGDGAYLTYPFEDLLRLLTLEAYLADAFIIAEDLGTAPHGFSEAIARRKMLGMRVLWFERASDDGFIGAHDYGELAVAMTGTHDTPTVAGWWSGRDLDWAETLGRLPEGVDRVNAEQVRDWDRGLLWSTMEGHTPRPAPDEPKAAVDAAIAHIARTPSMLALVPLEDLLGLAEQPNIPGTTCEHPNWRRRLDADLDELLAAPEVRTRMTMLRSG